MIRHVAVEEFGLFGLQLQRGQVAASAVVDQRPDVHLLRDGVLCQQAEVRLAVVVILQNHRPETCNDSGESSERCVDDGWVDSHGARRFSCWNPPALFAAEPPSGAPPPPARNGYATGV